jgi:hypothetical protein
VNPPNYLIFSVKLFSIFYLTKQSLLNFTEYSIFLILSNSEDTQLQAKNTEYSVKFGLNWHYLK